MRPLIAVLAIALASWSNGDRTDSARRRAAHWNQHADYTISATLDPLRQKISGRETIRFQNNSPDALAYLMVCHALAGSLTIDSVRVPGNPAVYGAAGTATRIPLATPLLAGASVDVQVVWTLKVPEAGGHGIGHDGPLYEVGRWFPRPCDYTEGRGWSRALTESVAVGAADLGDFDVTLTVPFSYIVRATGELQNPETVLTPTEVSRLAMARTSDTTVHIVTSLELSDFTVFRPVTDGELTWHFTSRNTPDFAWAASPDFIWDAGGWDGILVETLYRRTAHAWSNANRSARESVRTLGEKGHRYPWTRAVVIEGPVDGVEYPMLVFSSTPVPRFARPQKEESPR